MRKSHCADRDFTPLYCDKGHARVEMQEQTRRYKLIPHIFLGKCCLITLQCPQCGYTVTKRVYHRMDSGEITWEKIESTS